MVPFSFTISVCNYVYVYICCIYIGKVEESGKICTRLLIEVTSEEWDWGRKVFHCLIYILLYCLKFRCTFHFCNCWLFMKGQKPLLNNLLFITAGFWVSGKSWEAGMKLVHFTYNRTSYRSNWTAMLLFLLNTKVSYYLF